MKTKYMIESGPTESTDIYRYEVDDQFVNLSTKMTADNATSRDPEAYRGTELCTLWNPPVLYGQHTWIMRVKNQHSLDIFNREILRNIIAPAVRRATQP